MRADANSGTVEASFVSSSPSGEIMQLLRRYNLLFIAILAGAASVPAFGDSTATSQIYQQRDADGHIVFTDRPAAKSVTERTWQMSREDPAAAQQRALEVKREADAVSERVQRSIEAQLRRSSEEDLMRMRLAMLERQNEASYDDGATYGYGYGYGYPLANRRLLDNRRLNHRPGQLPMQPPSRPPMRGGMQPF